MWTFFKQYRWELAGIGFVFALFLLAGIFVENYGEVLNNTLNGTGASAMLIYVSGATLATVIAPLSFLPVLPVAVGIWGSFVAALLSILGWWLGAAIAFLLARWFGAPFAKHFLGTERMNRIARFFPSTHLFIAVVLLRMAFPVDLLSYALGLFNVMRLGPYLVATLIGITPFAFVFSYLTTFPVLLQAGVLIAGIILAVLSIPYLRRRYERVFLSSSPSRANKSPK